MYNRKIKNLFRYICLLCSLSLCIAFTSCNGKTEEEETIGEKYYTVSFNTNGGSIVESLKVKENTYATRPEDPTLDNYVFSRWERDGREWHFDTKAVTEDVTLSALWVSAVELFELEPDEATGGLMIAGYKKHGSFSTLNIPSTINGKTVMGIAHEGMNNTNTDYAQKFIIPETVTFIGDEAFADSTEIYFDIKGTITRIGEASFKSCRLLEYVKLGEGITTIPFMCFYECASLKTINVPKGVTTIEENAFEGCVSMKTIVLPATLTSIQDSAFYQCKSIVSVFFEGTEEQFDKIDIADSNDPILDANIYFYSETQPSESGSFWHYENGSPVIWK